MNPPAYHPACCSPLREHWPLPQALPGARLVSCSFDPALLQADDFPACAIAPPRGASKRQSEFLAGRLCARQALLRLTGTAALPAVGADRAPRWPAGVVGSITHGQGWAAAVVAKRSDYQGLGLDLEQCLDPARAERLAAQILTPSELQRLQQLPPAQRAEQLTLSFSLKESLFKALYPLVQQRFYFQDAELLNCPAEGSAELRLLRDLAPQWPAGSRCAGQFARFEERLLSLVSIPA